MAVVVLVQRNGDETVRYATWLQTQGRSFVVCRGPSAPLHSCAFLRDRTCQLWDAGDVFIYDPWLDVTRSGANSEELVRALRASHPSKPLILAGPAQVTPTWATKMAEADSLTRTVFPATRELLLSTVSSLLLAMRRVGNGAKARQDGPRTAAPTCAAG